MICLRSCQSEGDSESFAGGDGEVQLLSILISHNLRAAAMHIARAVDNPSIRPLLPLLGQMDNGINVHFGRVRESSLCHSCLLACSYHTRHGSTRVHREGHDAFFAMFSVDELGEADDG